MRRKGEGENACSTCRLLGGGGAAAAVRAAIVEYGKRFSGDASRQPTHLGPRTDKHDRALGSAFSLDEMKGNENRKIGLQGR